MWNLSDNEYMKQTLIAGMALVFSACASSSIVPEGPDSYMIVQQGATGFSSTASIKVDAIKAASQYCQGQGRQFKISRTSETPAGPGRFPTVEVGFLCLKEGDPDLTRTNMVPAENAANAQPSPDAMMMQMMQMRRPAAQPRKPMRIYQPSRPQQTNCQTQMRNGTAYTDCTSAPTGVDTSIYNQ